MTEPEAAKTDEDVIVQTVVALMNREPKFSDQTGVLSKKLQAIQTAKFIAPF